MTKNNGDDITIYDDEGKQYLMKILFTYENKERNSEYVFIYSPDAPEDIYLMKYNENNELFEVKDEEEIEEANEVLDAFNNDDKIQELKESE